MDPRQKKVLLIQSAPRTSIGARLNQQSGPTDRARPLFGVKAENSFFSCAARAAVCRGVFLSGARGAWRVPGAAWGGTPRPFWPPTTAPGARGGALRLAREVCKRFLRIFSAPQPHDIALREAIGALPYPMCMSLSKATEPCASSRVPLVGGRGARGLTAAREPRRRRSRRRSARTLLGNGAGDSDDYSWTRVRKKDC